MANIISPHVTKEAAYQAGYAQGCADTKEKLENVKEVLHRIESWCLAYPLSVFPEPDWKEVKEKLGSSLLTRVSGSNMRHVCEGIQRIIREGLKDVGK